LLPCLFQEKAAIVNDHMRVLSLQNAVPVGMEVVKELGHAGQQFDRGGWDSPGNQRTICGSHSETDDQRVFRGLVVKRQREMGHHFGDGRQLGDPANPIDI